MNTPPNVNIQDNINQQPWVVHFAFESAVARYLIFEKIHVILYLLMMIVITGCDFYISSENSAQKMFFSEFKIMYLNKYNKINGFSNNFIYLPGYPVECRKANPVIKINKCLYIAVESINIESSTSLSMSFIEYLKDVKFKNKCSDCFIVFLPIARKDYKGGVTPYALGNNNFQIGVKLFF